MDTLLRQLVEIPSVCGNIPAAQRIIDFTASYLEKRGLYVQHFVSNGFPSIVATTTPHAMTPTVMLAAHLDVAPAPPELFTLRLENGKYFGRGVFDMKFAAAAYLHLVDQLKPRLQEYDFGIMLTTDEERYGPYGTGMLVEKGYLPKVCVLPDCSEDWNIETFAKGRYFANIQVTGIAAHGSRPWEGDSASIKLITLLHKLHAIFENDQQPHTDTFNIGVVKSGSMVNQIPDSAEAHVDIRFTDEAAFEKRKIIMQNLCAQYGATISMLADEAAPVVNDLNNPYIKAFAACVTAETGLIPQGTSSFAASDARFFARVGVPCVASSPSGGKRHAAGEWLDAASFAHMPAILQAYLDKIACSRTGKASAAKPLTIPTR